MIFPMGVRARIRVGVTVALVGCALAANVWAQQSVTTERGPMSVVTVAEGLQAPWGLAFLPDGRMLVTERPGRLRIVALDGRVSAPVDGVPRVHASGQGGLLDVVVGPDFERDHRVYFSYAEPTGRGARTAVARAVLDAEALTLSEVEQVFSQHDDPSGRHHFGSRLVFGHDGSLYVGLGDRFFHRDRAQTLDNHIGKVVRVMPDGSVPADNPFVGQRGALPEIWSYGHRNIQGAALHPETGVLWTHEHGPQGGDEVNAGVAGANYGWPVVTYGREYMTGARIGEATERDGVEAPVLQWTPSIAPSGMAFYTAGRIQEWQGNLFVGALRGQSLFRLVLEGDRVVHQERMLGELNSRIRDVREGPDGLLYLLDDSNGRVLRLEPLS